jgi:hypothetical protein
MMSMTTIFETPHMTSPSARHRGYLIEFDQDAQGWRVVAVTHAQNGSSLLRPAFYYPDQGTAEQYAKAAIDQQLAVRRGR